MIHAYDKIYLALAKRSLAKMVDYLVNDVKLPLENAWQRFLVSSVCARFEQGDCAVLAGMSGVELAYAVLESEADWKDLPKPSYSRNRSPEYWTGWALACYQWETGLRFWEIEQAVSISDVRSLYAVYHELDIRQFIDKMNRLYRVARPETNLKALRLLSGMSLIELAQQSGIPVRTIQQYEQRQRDINKVPVETLLRIAKALCCNMEDLVERVPARFSDQQG